MQIWDIGKFLRRSVPQEVGILRLADVNHLCDSEMHAWRIGFIPKDTPRGAVPSWEFRIYILWDPDDEQPRISFSSYACVALPHGARRWLEYGVNRYNDDVETKLVVYENKDRTLSMYASRTAVLSKEHADLLSKEKPPRGVVDSFFASYAECISLLFIAWKEGLRFGEYYRTLH